MTELFRIIGSVVVDNTEGVEAIRNTANEGEKAQGKLSGAFEKIGGFAVKAGKVIASGLAVGVGALATLTTMSVKSYAEYEQLVGGVETLFGTGGQSIEEYAESVGKTVEAVRGEYETLMKSQETVLQNANEAYKNAGMSANEYMETVTGFSASLIQSLSKGAQTNLDELNASLANQYTETERALEDQYDAVKSNWDDVIALAKKNKASNVDILKKQRDEELKLLKRKHSDSLAELKAYNKEQLAEAEKANNVSTKSAEAQLEASKKADQAIRDMADNANKMGSSMESIQNAYQGFAKQNYTMLDNLKLGYGGTQEEMKRLIQDASRMTDIQKELGITVDENSMSFGNIVDAISVVQKSMGIMGTTSKEASETIEGSMSAMKASWQNLVTGFGNEDADLSGLIDQFTESALTVADNLLPRIEIILNGIAEAIPRLVPKITEKLPQLMESMLPPLLEGAVALFNGLLMALPPLVQVLLEQLPTVVSQIATGFAEAFPILLDTVTTLFGQLFDYISLELLNTGVSFDDACSVWGELFGALWEVLQTIWETIGVPIWDAISFACESLVGLFASYMPQIQAFAQNAMAGIKDTWENHLKPAFEAIGTFLEAVLKPAFEFVFETIIMPLVDNAFSYIVSWWNDTLKPVFDGICDFLTGVFTGDWQLAFDGIMSIVEGVLAGIQNGFNTVMETIKDIVNKGIEKVKGFFKFEWSLPKLKMPHFKISGEFSLNPPSVPSFGIDWYAKAMDNPMIMDTPTAFGINANGQIMAGGEAGSEVVSGTETLMNMISNAVATQNTALIAVLERILDAILALDANMGGNMREAIENTRFELNNREFARLVKAVN